MDPNAMSGFAGFVGFVIGSVIGAAIGSLFGGLLLKWASGIVTKKHVAYGSAYAVVFIALMINSAVGALFGVGAGIMGLNEGQLAILQLALVPVALLIQSGVISWNLDISYGQSVLVSLLMAVIAFVIAVVLLAVFAGLGVAVSLNS